MWASQLELTGPVSASGTVDVGSEGTPVKRIDADSGAYPGAVISFEIAGCRKVGRNAAEIGELIGAALFHRRQNFGDGDIGDHRVGDRVSRVSAH